MRYLGKIFFALFIAQQAIYADVVANVDNTHVSFGEIVTYNLVLSGEDIKKPNIYTLCGEDVVGTGSSTSINVVNGEYKKSYVLSYKFIPKKSCTIEAVSLDVDGKIQKTEPIDIVVAKFVPSVNDDFSLILSASKDEVYVGEAIELTLLFKQKKSAKVVDNKFTNPEFKGFWLKGEPKQEITEDAAYVNTKVIYKVAPQREGVLEITPANIAIASRKNTKNYYGGFFPEVKWKTYFSNDLNITSKPVASDVDVVGDIEIEASADTLEVNPNEAVNVSIKVKGEANLEDIKAFKPYIDGVSVFDEKIVIKDDLLSQKITFVADRSFTIPAFSLRVFNPITEETKVVSTEEIMIKVNNAKVKPEEELKIKREDKPVAEKEKVIPQAKAFINLDIFWTAAIFLAGVMIGVLFMLLKPLISFKNEKKFDIKDHKMLLVKLMPFEENEDVRELMSVLEANIYKNENIKIDTKKIKEIVKKYEIS
ncbi:MAG: BatD family protein [Helicobacteraceae bacterium]|nr:BatD family protein [Candidatus Sulfurimonas ponti]